MRASLARKPKHDVTDTSGIEHVPSHERGVSAVPIGLKIVRIYTDLTTKLLKVHVVFLHTYSKLFE